MHKSDISKLLTGNFKCFYYVCIKKRSQVKIIQQNNKIVKNNLCGKELINIGVQNFNVYRLPRLKRGNIIGLVTFSNYVSFKMLFIFIVCY